MIRGLFVTGTDTGVGKTVVCSALLARCAGDPHVRYWKPIQTGIEEDDDSATVRRLTGCASARVLDAGVRLRRPLSPHRAAELSGVVIDLAQVSDIAGGQDRADRWIVEGAGGVLVPLNDDQLMVDLMVHLGLAVVVVARSTLGTINHTLLTIEALRARSMHVAGVIMVGDPHPDNRRAIERRGRVDAVVELPRLSPLTPEALERAALAMDCDGLSSWLR